ncbi:MAG: lipoyl(octanoyl) transferase LipB [Chitinophagales bacterium]
MDSGDRGKIRFVVGQIAEPYLEVAARQEELFQKNLEAKAVGGKTENTLILCEHLPVYTLGKSGKKENLLFDPAKVGAAFVPINRGGDITFHGPGQLVAYPIFDLDQFGIGIAEFVFLLEEIVIKLLSEYELQGKRIPTASGVWLDIERQPRKICAVGLRVSRHCTMHGIALNINTDLSFFDHIIPCGLKNMGVTSMQQELGRIMDFNAVRNRYSEIFIETFGKEN